MTYVPQTVVAKPAGPVSAGDAAADRSGAATAGGGVAAVQPRLDRRARRPFTVTLQIVTPGTVFRPPRPRRGTPSCPTLSDLGAAGMGAAGMGATGTGCRPDGCGYRCRDDRGGAPPPWPAARRRAHPERPCRTAPPSPGHSGSVRNGSYPSMIAPRPGVYRVRVTRCPRAPRSRRSSTSWRRRRWWTTMICPVSLGALPGCCPPRGWRTRMAACGGWRRTHGSPMRGATITPPHSMADRLLAGKDLPAPPVEGGPETPIAASSAPGAGAR